MSKQITYQQEVFRKLIHLSSLWMVISLGVLPRRINVILFTVLLFGCIFVEYGNHRQWPLFTKTYGRFFNNMLRESERGEEFRLSGAPYVLGAALMSSILFESITAMIALSVMLIGDTCAALIGRKFGRHKINYGRKSIEGAAAFWLSSALILAGFATFYALPTVSIVMGLVGISLAMIAEIYENQVRMDDNFSIPLLLGLALSVAPYL